VSFDRRLVLLPLLTQVNKTSATTVYVWPIRGNRHFWGFLPFLLLHPKPQKHHRHINADLVLPPPLNNLFDDPNGRIYRGLSPTGVPANFFGPGVPAAAIAAPPQDWIETVSFPKPGTYLVICGVRTHFVGGMFGYVIVVP
jgi:hypothetical protein